MTAIATLQEAKATAGSREDGRRIMRPLPDDVIERLADLWCEALLANLRRQPVIGTLPRVV